MPVRTLRLATKDVALEAESDRPLLDVLRAKAAIRSIARGCSNGLCGACRVLIDGALTPSCRIRWADVRDGATIETYEELAADPAAARAVEAFGIERPTRCRMCVGALGVTAVAITRSGKPREEATEEALLEATCLCTGRGSWRRALSK